MSALKFRAQQAPTLIGNNPITVQLLGLSPVLALSTSLSKGIAIGILASAVLILSSLTLSLTRKLINAHWRFVYYLFLLSCYTTAAEIVLEWQLFALYRELGIYVPLICCNMALLLHLECQANCQAWTRAFSASVHTALGYLIFIAGFSALREWLTTGRVLNDWQLLQPAAMASADFAPSTTPLLFNFVELAPAALILLGIVLALKNALFGVDSQKNGSDLPVGEVQRARVTGKI